MTQNDHSKTHEQGIRGWVESRTGLNLLLKVSLDEPVPGGTRWAYVFGSGLLFVFISQVITGICLALYYVPSAQNAHVTVAYISKQVAAGEFLRSLHVYGASAMIVVLALHFLQTFLWGAYKGRRELLWISGGVLASLVLAMGFTGYLLPWDQKFYLAHVIIIPALIFTFIATHIYLFRKAGAAGPILASTVTGAASSAPAQAASATAPAAATAQAREAATAQRSSPVMQGEHIFVSHGCIACHGANGVGTPLAISLIGVTHKFPHDQLINLIRHPNAKMKAGGMPTFTFTDPQMDNLVAYLAQLHKPTAGAGASQASASATHPTPPHKLTAEEQQGRGIYVSARCSTCHGDGGMAGTAAAPSLTSTASELPPDMIRHLLEHPSIAMQSHGMPPVDLSQQDLKALIAYVRALRYNR